MNVKDKLASLIYSFFAIDKKENPAPPMAQGVCRKATVRRLSKTAARTNKNSGNS